MAKEIKVLKAEKFAQVIAILEEQEQTELVEFIQAELDRHNARQAKAKERAAKKRAESDVLVDAGFKPKTKAYNKAYAEEKRNRIVKAKSSRSEYAIWKSMNQKLDVELAKIAAEEAFEKRKNKKAKTADAVA